LEAWTVTINPGPAFTDVAELAPRLQALETVLRDRGDRRAVFATVYALMSATLTARIGDFASRDWAAAYAVAFANLYRDAFIAFELGTPAQVPKAWALSFDVSRRGDGLVLHDALLGINAHINNDLPLAIGAVLEPRDRDRQRADHDRVNAVLVEVMDPIQARLAAVYAPGLRLLDDAAGPLDERVTSFSLQVARQQAWLNGVVLADATGDLKSGLKAGIAKQAAAMARVILSPGTTCSWMLPVLRFIESRHDWRDIVPASTVILGY
jgi:hypothetical protein